jgi:hypothetical protein
MLLACLRGDAADADRGALGVGGMRREDQSWWGGELVG